MEKSKLSNRSKCKYFEYEKERAQYLNLRIETTLEPCKCASLTDYERAQWVGSHLWSTKYNSVFQSY